MDVEDGSIFWSDEAAAAAAAAAASDTGGPPVRGSPAGAVASGALVREDGCSFIFLILLKRIWCSTMKHGLRRSVDYIFTFFF